VWMMRTPRPLTQALGDRLRCARLNRSGGGRSDENPVLPYALEAEQSVLALC